MPYGQTCKGYIYGLSGSPRIVTVNSVKIVITTCPVSGTVSTGNSTVCCRVVSRVVSIIGVVVPDSTPILEVALRRDAICPDGALRVEL